MRKRPKDSGRPGPGTVKQLTQRIVDTAQEKERAREIVPKVKGMRSARNNIVVK